MGRKPIEVVRVQMQFTSCKWIWPPSSHNTLRQPRSTNFKAAMFANPVRSFELCGKCSPIETHRSPPFNRINIGCSIETHWLTKNIWTVHSKCIYLLEHCFKKELFLNSYMTKSGNCIMGTPKCKEIFFLSFSSANELSTVYNKPILIQSIQT